MRVIGLSLVLAVRGVVVLMMMGFGACAAPAQRPDPVTQWRLAEAVAAPPRPPEPSKPARSVLAASPPASAPLIESPWPEPTAPATQVELSPEECLRRSCRERTVAQRARLAELEPLVVAIREKQGRAAMAHASDETWVRAHCRWDNDPQYAIEARRRAAPRGSKQVTYDVDERMVGFASSRPICPKEATRGQLVVAGELAANLVNGGRVAFKNAGLSADEVATLREQKELAESLQFCASVTGGKGELRAPGSEW